MISGPLHSPNSTTMNSTRPSISCIDGASSRLQKIAKGNLQSSCRTLSKLPNLYHESRAQPCGIRLKWNKNVRKPAGTLLPSRDTSFMQVKNIFWVLVHVHVKSMAPLSNSHTKGMAIRRKKSRTWIDCGNYELILDSVLTLTVPARFAHMLSKWTRPPHYLPNLKLWCQKTNVS